MRSKEYKERVLSTFAKCMHIYEKKAEDYTSGVDVLDNFKRVAAATYAIGINTNTPVGYALFMVLMKLDRFNNIISKRIKLPANEGLEDTAIDLINYINLALALVNDKKSLANPRKYNNETEKADGGPFSG